MREFQLRNYDKRTRRREFNFDKITKILLEDYSVKFYFTSGRPFILATCLWDSGWQEQFDIEQKGKRKKSYTFKGWYFADSENWKEVCTRIKEWIELSNGREKCFYNPRFYKVTPIYDKKRGFIKSVKKRELPLHNEWEMELGNGCTQMSIFDFM